MVLVWTPLHYLGLLPMGLFPDPSPVTSFGTVTLPDALAHRTISLSPRRAWVLLLLSTGLPNSEALTRHFFEEG